jgi:predicted dehydrogenase
VSAQPAPVEAVLIGAGERGTYAYGAFAEAYPKHLRFVAVAEPDPEQRARFAARHHVPPERSYESWEDLIATGQLAPALICCTMDRQHVAPTVAALEARYHVLLEKPIAVTPTTACAWSRPVSERTVCS